MENDKIIFKCLANSSIKNFVESNRVYHKKKYIFYRIILLIFIIFLFLFFVFSKMDELNLFFTEAMVMYFTDTLYPILDTVFVIWIFKIAEVDSLIRIFFRLILNGNNPTIGYSYICFYEDKYILFTEVDSKVYSKDYIYYNSIKNCYVTENIIILNSNPSKLIICKDLFTVGTVEQFIEFLHSKIGKSNVHKIIVK
ncbi:MAG: hypothetical protein E6929_05475 [Clostridium sp.]|nr:hypothetical protein [Clostridium sp.]